MYSPVLKPKEKTICETVVRRYKLAPMLNEAVMLFGVVYGKGMHNKVHDAPGAPVVRFFDISVSSTRLHWDRFEEFCLDHELPMISVDSSEQEDGCVVRPVQEFEERKYTDLIKRVCWHML